MKNTVNYFKQIIFTALFALVISAINISAATFTAYEHKRQRRGQFSAGDFGFKYGGDGKTDPTVFRLSSTTWFVNRSTAGLLIVGFGFSDDKPVPNAFVP